MPSRAFSPCHITGFFEIFDNGSTGAGVCLAEGMTTEAGRAERTAVTINGRSSPAPVSREVVSRFSALLGRPVAAVVRHSCPLPVGSGFGASAAGALSLSLALNEEFQAGLSPLECARIAHEAELACRTGLGGVIAEFTGGFVLRKEPGSFDAAERLPLPEGYRVVFAHLRGIQTRRVITDAEWRKRINAAGEHALAVFRRRNSPEDFMELSRSFAFETLLASGRISRILEAIPACSMTMLGKAVFSLTDEPGKVARALRSLGLSPKTVELGGSKPRVLKK
ncbi:MAG: pantoate kinase [Candidatus Micrarchaeia archaeon]